MWRHIRTWLFGEVLEEIRQLKGLVMAIGPETRAALEELGARIQAEAEQHAQQVIDAVGADTATAAAIREHFSAVANIVPDAVEETPAEPETPDVPEVPVEDVEADTPDQPA